MREASKEQTLFLPQGLSNLVRRTGLVNRSLECETDYTLCREKDANPVMGVQRGEKSDLAGAVPSRHQLEPELERWVTWRTGSPGMVTCDVGRKEKKGLQELCLTYLLT